MKNKIFKSLVVTGMLLGSAVIAQAEPFYIEAPEAASTATGTADQMGINWSATSNYFDTNGDNNLGFGDKVVDLGAGNVNGLLVGGVPLVGADLDGMNSLWNLTFEYDNLTGIVQQNPDNQNIVARYTSGQINIYYDEPAEGIPGGNSKLVMVLDVFDSNAQIFNALFFTHVDFTGVDVIAQDMFYFADGTNMYDLWFDGGLIDPLAIQNRIDTNLDGPVVTRLDDPCVAGDTVACWTRTSTLNGSAQFVRVPEPSILALLGGGLLMMGFTRRGKKS